MLSVALRGLLGHYFVEIIALNLASCVCICAFHASMHVGVFLFDDHGSIAFILFADACPLDLFILICNDGQLC